MGTEKQAPQERDAYTKTQLINLGKRLRAMRKAKGYNSFERFAYENGFNRAQIGRYEKGANISFETLTKILHALDVSIEEFFEEGFGR